MIGRLMFQNELWAEISEFPHYSVSNYGRIKHKDRDLARKLTVNERGFVVIQLLSATSSSRYLRQVNVLVAKAFLPQPEYVDYNSVWHIDGDLKNCRAENLRWEMRSRVLEWNEMHRTGQPRYTTPAVMNNETETLYANAFECALAEGTTESRIMWFVEKQAAGWQDTNAKYCYVFENEVERI